MELKAEATIEYGHQDGYSGQINSCGDITLHRPSKPLKTDKQLWDYVQDRMDDMGTGVGEVIDLGIVSYSIAKPVVKEFTGRLQIDFSQYRSVKDPAILLHPNGRMIATGTLAELKEKAKRLVLQETFENDYYIVGKSTKKVYVVTGEGKMVKTTTKKSDANCKVIPYHNYVVYGWARS
jgi:hypothetical protein